MVPPPADEPRRAGLWRRLAALFYDGLLLVSVLFLATALVLPLTGGEAVAVGNPLFKTYLFLIVFFYFAWHWVRNGQTLGMRAWRLRVLRQDGAPLTWWHALLRFLVALVSAACLGLGFLWVLFDRRRLTWHDRASETMVIVEERARRGARPSVPV